ncbi:efflux RND transporter periplasmic adaptor subunit [Phreatobacter stygius]|uniref:Efflux RND transporter periplasmic adaptor subunit n=1 Tax=Phreatobacter stygius TaxID=1940610 RepID=A0A4D7AZD7_9HYPH|nr:efflux RND transporter periplasmic adaptor subunit [Phreatobacter stygius]QCI64143.1 efflux RND transporter periplasmic adaptor subunit [Phreatobacter stygius]
MTRSRLVLLVLAAAAAGAGYYWWEIYRPAQLAQSPDATPGASAPRGGGGGRGGGRRGGFAGDPPPSVVVVAPRVADVPVHIDAVGTVLPLRNVTVRPQVDGRLIEVTFREGQTVKAGDVLARIDPTVYQAQYDQVVAKKAQDEAILANARLDLARYTRLATDNSGSRQQADTQRALVAQYEAQVRLDQAAIDNARAVLSYTTIVSPIDGRTGIRMIDEGNFVQASATTGLVVVAQVNPIAVTFSVPQQQLRTVVAALARGRPKTEIVGAEGGRVQETGTLEVVDNQIDQTTGTVKLKAIFGNDAAHLWPGQYVSVRLEVDILKGVTVVPGEAVQRGPSGTFVYVMKDEASVGVRPVQVAREADGLAVLTGVTPQDRVVTIGFARLADGAAVRVAQGQGGRAPGGAPAGAPGSTPDQVTPPASPASPGAPTSQSAPATGNPTAQDTPAPAGPQPEQGRRGRRAENGGQPGGRPATP